MIYNTEFPSMLKDFCSLAIYKGRFIPKTYSEYISIFRTPFRTGTMCSYARHISRDYIQSFVFDILLAIIIKIECTILIVTTVLQRQYGE